MKIKKEILIELIDFDEFDSYSVVSGNYVESSRWSRHYEMVFKDITTDKYYITYYSVGATECQDEAPYEYEPDEIEVKEVKPVEKTIIVYE